MASGGALCSPSRVDRSTPSSSPLVNRLLLFAVCCWTATTTACRVAAAKSLARMANGVRGQQHGRRMLHACQKLSMYSLSYECNNLYPLGTASGNGTTTTAATSLPAALRAPRTRLCCCARRLSSRATHLFCTRHHLCRASLRCCRSLHARTLSTRSPLGMVDRRIAGPVSHHRIQCFSIISFVHIGWITFCLFAGWFSD